MLSEHPVDVVLLGTDIEYAKTLNTDHAANFLAAEHVSQILKAAGRN